MKPLSETHPSLANATATMDFADEGGGERYKPISAGMMFGSLVGEGPVVHVLDVQRHTIDKSKAREKIIKYFDEYNGDENGKIALLRELGL